MNPSFQYTPIQTNLQSQTDAEERTARWKYSFLLLIALSKNQQSTCTITTQSRPVRKRQDKLSMLPHYTVTFNRTIHGVHELMGDGKS